MLSGEKINNFLANLIKSGREISFLVGTDSMSPLIRPGDKIVVKNCSSGRLRPGDIILYEIEGELYAHRFLARRYRKGNSFLITKGDRFPGQRISFLPPESLRGKVSAIKKGKTTVNLETLFWKASNLIIATFLSLEGYLLHLYANLKVCPTCSVGQGFSLAFKKKDAATCR